MFHMLAQRFQDIFQSLRGRGALSQHHVEEALRHLRVALLEADVALPAVKSFLEPLSQALVGEKILKSINPEDMVTKFVHDGLVRMLAHEDEKTLWPPTPQKKPYICLVVGLQGSGKTTMCAKLAHKAQKEGHRVLLASGDIHRPMARQQLEILAQGLGVDSLPLQDHESSTQIAHRALDYGQSKAASVVIFDTAGRTEIQESLMEEVRTVKHILCPQEVLFVADALLGQSSVRVAQGFHAALGITGICLSKVDADVRGGAALSLRHILEKPIKLLGVGEKPQEYMACDAQRLAHSILGKGDVVALVEKAANTLQEEDARSAMGFLKSGLFTLEDLAQQILLMQRMGGLGSLLRFLPGMGALKNLSEEKSAKDVQRTLAIIRAMTMKERRMPSLLNASRKKRIALGSGVDVAAVNTVLKRHQQMAAMLKTLRSRGVGR